jgi:hypothetical protein
MKKTTFIISTNTFDHKLKSTDKEAYMNETKKFKASKDADKPWKGTWENRTVSVLEFVQYLKEQHAFTPIKSTGVENSDNGFAEAQVVAMDFDNGETPEQVQEALKALHIYPNIIYTTASDTPEQRRFRAVIFMDSPTFSITEYRSFLYGSLVALDSKGIRLDTRTTNASHCYYPGKEIIFVQDAVYTKISAFQKIARLKAEKDNVVTEWELADSQKEADKMGVSLSVYYKRIGKKMPKKISNAYKHFSLKNIENWEEAKMSFVEEKENNMSQHTAEIVKAFINKDVKKLKSIIGTIEAPTDWNLLGYTEREDLLSITNLFGVNLNENFHCWLPGHNEENPSANITTAPDGSEIYKCFGCGHTHRLTNLVGTLIGGNLNESSRFIEKVTGLRFMSPYQETSIVSVSMFKNNFNDESFEINFPNLSKLMKKWRLTGTYYMMLDLASQLVPMHSLSNNPKNITFFSPQSRIKQVSKNYRDNSSKNHNVHIDLTILCELGLLNKEVDVREEAMSFAKKIQINAQAKHGRTFSFHTDFYTVPVDDSALELAESVATTFIKSRARKRTTSIAQTVAIVGEDRANSSRPQQEFDVDDSKRIVGILEKMTKKIIDTKGFATEEDVVRAYYESKNRKAKKAKCQQLFDVNRASLGKSDCFNHTTVNKATRLAYNIPAEVKSRKMIFVN